ncbi:MAG: glycine--tRNA ligase [Thermoplasmata archaeon]
MGRYDELMSLALRRGFLLPSAEIYGGLAGFYDYGPHGARLRRKWEDLWLTSFLRLGDNYHLIDTPTIQPYPALEASGHVELFADVLVPCTRCKETHKADELIHTATGTSGEGMDVDRVRETLREGKIVCPRCGGSLGDPTSFHLMFPVAIGPKGEERAFLRPETAQGAYLSFKRAFEILRKRLPLGLAIVGRAYRNEISPRQGAFRLREFHQAELQIFFDPEGFEATLDLGEVEGTALQLMRAADRTRVVTPTVEELLGEGRLPPFYLYHLAKVQAFYVEDLQVPPTAFRFYELAEEERAFYNRIHFDVQLALDSWGGFQEVGGVHYRTDYDLRRHQERSGEKMTVFHDGRRFVPHVLELSFGVDRNVWAVLDLGYETGDRAVLHLPPRLAPVTCGVFPLLNRDGLPDMAEGVYRQVRTWFDATYDTSGSIGRRYARMDEIGTPYCLTVDYDSLEQEDVTLRDRDSTRQARVAVKDLRGTLQGLLEGTLDFDAL